MSAFQQTTEPNNPYNSFVKIELIYGKPSAYLTIGDEINSHTWAVTRYELKLLLDKLLRIEADL